MPTLPEMINITGLLIGRKELTLFSKRAKWIEWLALIAILAVATFLRYWRLGEAPPGFNSDEAVGAMGAITSLREGLKYSYEGQGGGGALGFYFATVAFYLFGPSIETIRGLAAWAAVVGLFANYWAIRELFRPVGLNQARWLAGLTTLGMSVSVWHLSVSRIAFAGIGVPFLMLPSVYFLWRGLNNSSPPPAREEATPGSLLRRYWPFVVSGLFLGSLLYIYLSGAFAPILYAAFFVAQWGVVRLARRFDWQPVPPLAYMTGRFWSLFVTAATAGLVLLPMIYVLLTRPELEPGATRASQAFFLNPAIHQGDPWGLLWRSILGNFGGYGVSLSWLVGQPPARLQIPPFVGLLVFLGFLITLWRSVRGQAPYLFMLLWYAVMLLPSILSPDAIPHNLRTIGATTPVYLFVAVFVVGMYQLITTVASRRSRHPLAAKAVGLVVILVFLGIYAQATAARLNYYFNIFPQTNDAKAAYHVYAVRMAEVINREAEADVSFILPRNTAAGDVFRNFTTDFLVELEQPPADHYWIVDDEESLPAALTEAAAGAAEMRLVHWKTSKHTGADPKEVIPYYLEKYGHYDHTNTYEYFDIDTYRLEVANPDFGAAEMLRPVEVNFDGQLQLTGYGLGDAGAVDHLTDPQAASNDLLWLRLAWRKLAPHPENLKVSALLYAGQGQLVAQIDKLLLSNILQTGSAKWEIEAEETTYFLFPIPPATPPGEYTLKLAVYGADSLARLPIAGTSHIEAAAGLTTLGRVRVVPAREPVDLDQLELALPVGQQIRPGLTLVGFETLPGKAVRAGEQLWASLIWQAGESPPPVDLTMSLEAKAGKGEELWTLSEPVGLAGPDYPTSAWRPGETLRGWLSARIPPGLEPGPYKLRLHLAAPEGEPLMLPIGDFEVTGWPRVFEPPHPQAQLEADFDGQATLLGLDPPPETVAPGETVEMTLYWRAESEFERNYVAFVHLIGPDGRLYGQTDQIPGAGAFPTTGWLPGEYITDAYRLTVDPNAPSGPYRLEIGLYNPATGQRLPVKTGACEACRPADDKVLWPGPTVQ